MPPGGCARCWTQASGVSGTPAGGGVGRAQRSAARCGPPRPPPPQTLRGPAAATGAAGEKGLGEAHARRGAERRGGDKEGLKIMIIKKPNHQERKKKKKTSKTLSLLPGLRLEPTPPKSCEPAAAVRPRRAGSRRRRRPPAVQHGSGCRERPAESRSLSPAHGGASLLLLLLPSFLPSFPSSLPAR